MPKPKNTSNTNTISNKPTFKKRVNPHGWTLRKTSEYYKPPKNNQMFNTATGGNCVWYAYGRFLEVWSQAPEKEKKAHPWPGSFSNDGVAMVSSARAQGFKTGLIPKPGAIMSWGYNGSQNGHPGHVAFVEAVNTDKKGNIISIEVSQSGWSSGDLKNDILTPGPSGGKRGPTSWVVNGGYCRPYFVGFAYNPIEFAGSDGVLSGIVDDNIESKDVVENEEQIALDLQTRASKLVSSDSYSFIQQPEEAQSTTKTSALDGFKQTIQDIQVKNPDFGKSSTNALNTIDDIFAKTLNDKLEAAPKIIKKKSYLSIADNVVEAPFIELEFNGNKIGSYNGSLDIYPNYISNLQVTKQNGIINQYTINLVHQIKPYDDANLIDELLSTVNYDKITIRYGDANSKTYFQDVNAIITNVRMNRSYTNMNISYTLEATSAGELIKTYTTTFPAVTAKPSEVLSNIIYGQGLVSEIVLEAFPGMRNKSFVYSNNLIPTNDSVVNLDAQSDVNIIDYINYLVGCMSNELSGNGILRNSTYYTSFVDNDINNPDGAYIKIKEITADINYLGLADKIYTINIGYPDNIVYDFSVDSTNSWELLYKNSEKSDEYFYTITNNGDIKRYYSSSLTSSLNEMSEVNKNWWTQMVKFPVTAQLTVKGLLKSIMLMDYINIDVLFYGQRHVTSGVYAITGQTDSLSGAGYKTTLSLVRIGKS